VDISEALLQEMAGIEAIKTIHADARKLDFEAGSFSKIIIYFAIQHFSEEEDAALLQSIFHWLRPGGVLFIGDVPDVERRFAFFNTPERIGKYFQSLVDRAPIIGTWFHRDFFTQIGKHAGFSEITVQNQPPHYINAHYRFDVVLKK
jgi:SAM-dependent methyltransferase